MTTTMARVGHVGALPVTVYVSASSMLARAVLHLLMFGF